MKTLKAGAVVLMVLLGLSVPALVLLYSNTICSTTTVWIECLLKHVDAIYIVAVLALLMGGWRLWLADRKDSREESDHWQNRFSTAVQQVLDDTGTGSLLDARRVHALREMAWIAEKYPTKFMSQAKDVVERFEKSADAERELEVITGGLLQMEANSLSPVSKEGKLGRIAKTGGAICDLYNEAASLREKWREKPAAGGSDDGP